MGILIDFSKAKKRKSNPKGYLGFLERKHKKELEEENWIMVKSLSKSENTELLRINQNCRKGRIFYWGFGLYLILVLCFITFSPNSDSYMDTRLINTIIIISSIVVFVGVGIEIFLHLEKKMGQKNLEFLKK